jgi:sugar O-acyltransferase (sialic acid O-acetyltransferase NeuD family)
MTSPSDVVVLGAGRGSAELIDFLASSPFRPVAVLDDVWPDGPSDVLGVNVVGRIDEASIHVAQGRSLLMGIANSRNRWVRHDIHRRLALPDSAWAVFRDPSSTVSPRADLGAGSILYPGVRVAAGARLGRQIVVYYNSVIHHDALLGEGVTVCAGVLVAGGVRVGDGSYLGIGCVLRDGITLGRGVLVGMGAVVTRDVPDGGMVAGVPARALRAPEVCRP